VTSRPDLPESLARSLCNQGHALQNKGPAHLVDAIGLYRKALACDPNCAEVHFALGDIARLLGHPREAVRSYATALVLEPDHVLAETGLIYVFQDLCDWGELALLWERARERIRRTPAPLIPPFAILAMPSSGTEQLAVARTWATHVVEVVRSVRDRLGFQFPRLPKRTLRIGYLSGHFHNMATACLITELFELHDRTRFAVYAYSYGPDDGSPIRQRLLRACDRFVDIASTDAAAVARRIHADGVDILVDLMGYLADARPEILALRPAPIQVSYLAYPGTTGAAYMDYVITDRFVTPPAQEPVFTEQCVFLPDCYQVNDRQRPIAETTPTRAECGLPAGTFVFCCFNNPYKFAPAMFDTWMRLLQAVPASVLWLLLTTPDAAVNLRREAATRGVTPARLVFAPRQLVADHLARHRLADLGLDTFPVTGHTTTSDALWAGLPVVTCAGETFVSRVAGSLLNAIGLPELVTNSQAEYEALALHLARNPAVLGELRERLAANRGTAPLFDTPRSTRHLERAYELMWEHYLRGEPPGRIEVPALDDPGGRREGQDEAGPCWAGVSRAA